jgi:hypothetical protein
MHTIMATTPSESGSATLDQRSWRRVPSLVHPWIDVDDREVLEPAAGEDGHHAAMIVARDDVAPGRRIAHLGIAEAADALGALVDADQVAVGIIHRDRGIDVVDDEIDQSVLVDAGTRARLASGRDTLARKQRDSDRAESLPQSQPARALREIDCHGPASFRADVDFMPEAASGQGLIHHSSS